MGPPQRKCALCLIKPVTSSNRQFRNQDFLDYAHNLNRIINQNVSRSCTRCYNQYIEVRGNQNNILVIPEENGVNLELEREDQDVNLEPQANVDVILELEANVGIVEPNANRDVILEPEANVGIVEPEANGGIVEPRANEDINLIIQNIAIRRRAEGVQFNSLRYKNGCCICPNVVHTRIPKRAIMKIWLDHAIFININNR